MAVLVLGGTAGVAAWLAVTSLMGLWVFLVIQVMLAAAAVALWWVYQAVVKPLASPPRRYSITELAAVTNVLLLFVNIPAWIVANFRAGVVPGLLSAGLVLLGVLVLWAGGFRWRMNGPGNVTEALSRAAQEALTALLNSRRHPVRSAGFSAQGRGEKSPRLFLSSHRLRFITGVRSRAGWPGFSWEVSTRPLRRSLLRRRQVRTGCRQPLREMVFRMIRYGLRCTDIIEADYTVSLMRGQKVALVHCAFCPPFRQLPEVSVQVRPEEDVRAKVAQCYPYGTRVEIRRGQAEHAQRVLLHILAKAPRGGETSGDLSGMPARQLAATRR